MEGNPAISCVFISIILKSHRPCHLNNFRPYLPTIFLSSGELFFFFFVTGFDNQTAACGSLFVSFVWFWGVVFVSWGTRSGVVFG